jgi:hypothetical protein
LTPANEKAAVPASNDPKSMVRMSFMSFSLWNWIWCAKVEALQKLKRALLLTVCCGS